MRLRVTTHVSRFGGSEPLYHFLRLARLTHVSMQDESGGAPVNILRLEVCLARADNELLWGESCRCVYVWCALFV
jgi:hypothetical protein